MNSKEKEIINKGKAMDAEAKRLYEQLLNYDKNTYDVWQKKRSAAVQAYKKANPTEFAHNRTRIDSLIAANQLAQYGFSASEGEQLKSAYQAHMNYVNLWGAADKAAMDYDQQYVQPIYQREIANTQKEEARQAKSKTYEAKKRQSDTGLARATLGQRGYSPMVSSKNEPDETVTMNKGSYTDRYGKTHKHTASIRNNVTGSTRIVNVETGEIVGSQQAKPEERRQLQKENIKKSQESSPWHTNSPVRDRAAEDKRWNDFVNRATKETPEEKAKREAEEKQRKEEEREAKRKQKEEKKAQDKARRQADHERREKEREQNKKEYNEALDKYKKERAEAKAKAKQEREETAKKRREEYVKQRDAKTDEGKKAGETAYKQINDYAYTAKESYRQQVQDGGYKGTSAEAKADLKNTLSDIWNMSTGDARKELSGAYSEVSPAIDTLKNARSTVTDLYKNTVIGGVTEMAGNAQMALSAGALAAVDKDGMVNLQKIILSQKLADRVVLDNIMDAVNGQMQTFKDAGAAIKNFYLVQHAYIAAYVKQTFGNPKFMKNITGVVAIKVGNYVEAWTNEQVTKYMDKANKKIDQVFTRIDKKIDKVSSKIDGALDKVDKLTQIDLLQKMNDKIDKFTSLQGLQNKLNKSPFGALLSPIVGAVGAVGGIAIKGMLAQTGITSAVARIQQRIVGLHDKIVQAKQFVAQKIQAVKDFVNNLKEKAKAIVTEFANKIVSDIKSKIQNAVAGAAGIKF